MLDYSIRDFIQTERFAKKWSEMGLTDDDLQTLETMLLRDPKLGDDISGGAGVRKLRFAYNGHGKRGGARVIYIDLEVKEHIILLDIYAKNEKDNLSDKEVALLSKLAKQLKGDDCL